MIKEKIKNKSTEKKTSKNITDKSETSKNEKNRLKGIQKADSRLLLKKLNKEFELTRQKKITKEERKNSIQKIYNDCKGSFTKLCYKRPSSKIIQCLIKYADNEIIDNIFEEIKNNISSIILTPFGKNVIEKLSNKNEKYRKLVLKQIKNDNKKIITDKIGIEFVNNLYSDMKEKEKNELIFSLYQNSSSVLLLEEDKNISMLPKEKINVEQIARKIINKGIVTFEISHDIIYLHFVSAKARNEKYDDILEILSDSVPDFLFTEKGIAIASEIVKHKNNLNKHEKMLKSMEPYLLKIFGDDWGVLFILEIMDIFDPVLIKSKIIGFVEKKFEEIFINENTSKVLVEILENTEKYNFEISKRMKEYIEENFTDWIRDYNNIVLIEFCKKDNELVNRCTEILRKYKENDILKNEFSVSFFTKLDRLGLVNLKDVLIDDYGKYFE